MIEAVFISDLHLSPHEPLIEQRFFDFTQWAATNTAQVYILGDFFHVWAGDDSLNHWSQSIANRLAWLASQGVNVYYIHGNRDFLLGSRFAQLANIKILNDPSVIKLGKDSILITHGDQYCTKDTGHQWLRRITRNRLFPRLFQKIPLKYRNKLVMRVRKRSQTSPSKPASKLEIIPQAMLKDMKHHKVQTIIHGHIHKPDMHYFHLDQEYRQIVLSDWDDKPSILCYDCPDRLYFKTLESL